MLALEFRKWSDHRDFERDAVFRVTNRGSRAVFVWNVRRQISTPSSNGVAKAWRTEDGDYPGRGWGNPMILPGGSEEFPMNDDAEGVWRVCLLYSRERPDSKPSNRLFDGTFEAIGPDMLGADTLEWQSSGRSTGE